MITPTAIAHVFVKDIDESKAFYIDVLGFNEKDDVSFGDYRWCTVSLPAQPELSLHLTTPSAPQPDYLQDSIRRAMAEGTHPGLGFQVDDCRQTYTELSAKGVEFVMEPADRPYGIEAVARDINGNWIVLVEPKFVPQRDLAQDVTRG